MNHVTTHQFFAGRVLVRDGRRHEVVHSADERLQDNGMADVATGSNLVEGGAQGAAHNLKLSGGETGGVVHLKGRGLAGNVECIMFVN